MFPKEGPRDQVRLVQPGLREDAVRTDVAPVTETVVGQRPVVEWAQSHCPAELQRGSVPLGAALAATDERGAVAGQLDEPDRSRRERSAEPLREPPRDLEGGWLLQLL